MVLQKQYDVDRENLGMPTVGRVVTATLYVSPDGNNNGGKSWDNAYTTIQAALDVASTDANDCTLILIAPHATYYDINTTGDPTWTGNYILKNAHRAWVSIKNTHASQTSIMKFTGKIGFEDLAFSLTAAGNGVVCTGKGFRFDNCGFNGETSTGASTALFIDGEAATKGGKIRNVEIFGNVSYTNGLNLDTTCCNEIRDLSIHTCAVGIKIDGETSDYNEFIDCDIGDCTLGLDLNAGNEQHFRRLNFHGCTTNIDDEVGDHIYENVTGQFAMDTLPDDLTGVTVTANNVADTWGTDVEILSAVSRTKPFRIVGYTFEPSVTQKHKVRFTADSGSIYFDEVFVEGKRNSAGDASSGTEYIFNAGTQIMASCKAETGGEDTIQVWIKVQEI